EHKASHLKEIFRELVENVNLSEIEKIDLIIDHYVDRIFSNPMFHHLLHRELSMNQRSKMHDGIINVLLKNILVIKKIIEKGIEQKVFREVDPEITIATII